MRGEGLGVGVVRWEVGGSSGRWEVGGSSGRWEVRLGEEGWKGSISLSTFWLPPPHTQHTHTHTTHTSQVTVWHIM